MRLKSESRSPGAVAQRHCVQCRAPLESTDDLRCAACRPKLSAEARLVGFMARWRRADLAVQERAIDRIEMDIRRAERALRKWLP